MATYSVLQDIEAEDKIIGALTLKQFVFACIAVSFLGIGWFVSGRTTAWVMVGFSIPAAPFVFLALPLGRDQPNDVWLGAKLRFWFKPRVRRWVQSSSQDFVSITAPKVPEHVYTDGLSHSEVRSRLQTLANSMDARSQLIADSTSIPPVYQTSSQPGSDNNQPLDPAVDMSQDTTELEGRFRSLIDSRAQTNREVALAKMQSVASSQSSGTGSPTKDEDDFLEKVHARQGSLMTKTAPVATEIVASSMPPPQVDQVAPTPTPVTDQLNSGIIRELAGADDLKVSTIAKMANSSKERLLLHDNEVISLH